MTAAQTIDGLAGVVLDELFERHPDLATSLGDHRFDDRLPDLSLAAAEQEVQWIDRCLAELGTLDDSSVGVDGRVDAAILRNRLEVNRFALAESRDNEWDPRVDSLASLGFRSITERSVINRSLDYSATAIWPRI